MSVRSYLNNNPAIVTIFAIVLLLVCLAIIYRTLSGGGGTTITSMYFYDLSTGETFVAPANSIPPIDAPSGPYQGQPGGVRAYVFSCTDCSDASSRQVAYLETYTLEAKRAMTSQDPDAAPDMFMYEEQGRLVKRPEEGNWARAESEEGFRVTEAVVNMCPSGTIQFCYPR